MTPPATYAQWVEFLSQLKEEHAGEQELLDVMESGTIVWSSGVAENLARRFAEIFNIRLKNANDRFQVELNRAGSHEIHIVGCILALRKRLGFLQRLATLKPLHPEIHKSLRDTLDQFCANCQKSLEESARSDRSGQLARILRHNPVKIAYSESSLSAPPPTPSGESAAARPFRKILLN